MRTPRSAVAPWSSRRPTPTPVARQLRWYASVVLAQSWRETGSHRQRRQHTDGRRAGRKEVQRGVGLCDPIALPIAQPGDVVAECAIQPGELGGGVLRVVVSGE